MLPVGQVIKTRETVAHFIEGFHELCGVQAAPIEYLLECSSAEVHLMAGAGMVVCPIGGPYLDLV